MYFASPSSTRLALGPGRAVLILGPIAVMVLVVMASSVTQRPGVSGQLSLHRASGQALVQASARRGESGQRMDLVATEQAGTQARRQIGPIPPRTNQTIQPALGRWCVRKMRIGIVAQHYKQSALLIDYSLEATHPGTPFGNPKVSAGTCSCGDSRPRLSHRAKLDCHPGDTVNVYLR